MQFQAPITIRDAISNITAGRYVIPVIQREFVWKPKQIERLFDSLLREYPIGAFLFWEVQAKTVAEYPFFEFSRHVVQGGDNHKKRSSSKNEAVTGILDGQQRLTAFLVGLTGTYKVKSKVGQAPRRLYLDVVQFNSEAGEEDLAYQFKFMTDDEAAAAEAPDRHWFCVADIMKMNTAIDVHSYLQSHGLIAIEGAFERLEKLREAVSTAPVINYYLEKRDDLGEVLNVFVRLNRGGTQLSYPDLLLSAATLGWKKYDAQTEFKACVDEMNQYGFDFTRDRVLKAGMVLSDLADIKFKAANFKAANANAIEAEWPKTKKALALAAALLHTFGLSDSTLTAQNVVIPVAYYLKRSGRTDAFLSLNKHQDDRERIQKFVLMSLLKGGFWTGAVDQVLASLRDSINDHGATTFPLDEVLTALRGINKPLEFTDAEIDSLLTAKYGNRSTALILSLIYPIPLVGAFHQDHVVPRARLVESLLKRQGMRKADIQLALSRRDQLPNLQLLPGSLNKEKSKKAIAKFVAEIRPVAKRQAYVDQHDLGKVPASESEFNRFYVARERVMRSRLQHLLN